MCNEEKFLTEQQHIFALCAILVCIATPSCRYASSDHTDCAALSFHTEDSVAWNILGNNMMLPFPSDIAVDNTTLHILGMMDWKWLHSYSLKDLSCQSSLNHGQG